MLDFLKMLNVSHLALTRFEFSSKNWSRKSLENYFISQNKVTQGVAWTSPARWLSKVKAKFQHFIVHVYGNIHSTNTLNLKTRYHNLTKCILDMFC